MAKDSSIESLRAIAIILVVGIHLGSDESLASARHFYAYIEYTFQNVRLPLFTVISGYLYGMRPVATGAFRPFMAGKLRRLIVPMLCVASLEYLALALAPGVNNPVPVQDVWRVWVLPFEHYWFLQAITLIFVFVSLLESRGQLESGRAFGLVLACSLALAATHFLLRSYFGVRLDPLSFAGATGLLPYFLWGVAVCRFGPALLARRTVTIGAVLLLAALALQQFSWFTHERAADVPRWIGKDGPVGYVFGMTCSLLLFALRPRSRWLARIGGYSFTIYLFQAFGAAIGRRLFDVPDINPHLYYLCVLSFVLAFGIVVELVLRRIPYVSNLFLGVSAHGAGRRVAEAAG